MPNASTDNDFNKEYLKTSYKIGKSDFGKATDKKVGNLAKKSAKKAGSTAKSLFGSISTPVIIVLCICLLFVIICAAIFSGTKDTDESDIYDICMNHAEITDVYKNDDSYDWIPDCRDQIYSLRQSEALKLSDDDRSDEEVVKKIRYKKIMGMSYLMYFWLSESRTPFLDTTSKDLSLDNLEISGETWSDYVSCFSSDTFQENLQNYFDEEAKIITSNSELTEDEKKANSEQEKVIENAKEKVVSDAFWDKLEAFLNKHHITLIGEKVKDSQETSALENDSNTVYAEESQENDNEYVYTIREDDRYSILNIAKIAYDRGYCGSSGVSTDDIQWPVDESAVTNTNYTSFADDSDRYGKDVWHLGFDFGVEAGTPVYAVFDGTFWWNGTYNSNGCASVTSDKLTGIHDKYLKAYYNHMQQVVVSSGSYVTKGQIIGYSGYGAGIAHLCFKLSEIGESKSERTGTTYVSYYYPFSYFGLKDPQPLCRDKGSCLPESLLNTGELSEY